MIEEMKQKQAEGQAITALRQRIAEEERAEAMLNELLTKAEKDLAECDLKKKRDSLTTEWCEKRLAIRALRQAITIMEGMP